MYLSVYTYLYYYMYIGIMYTNTCYKPYPALYIQKFDTSIADSAQSGMRATEHFVSERPSIHL